MMIKKSFWSTCKHLFSDKSFNYNESLRLNNDGVFIENEAEIASCFNSYFTNITSTLNIKFWKDNNLFYTNDIVIKGINK